MGRPPSSTRSTVARRPGICTRSPTLSRRELQRNLHIVDEVKAVASRGLVPTHGTIALAWRLAQGDDIASIPGTKLVARVGENTAADRVQLSAGQIERLNHLTLAVGERNDEGNMAVIDR